MWRERRGVPAVPLPRTDWLCHEMAKSIRINARPARPGARPSESAPSGQRACLAPWEQGREGTPRGRPPPSSYLLFPRPPASRPCRDVYSWTTSAGWRTRLSLSLVRMPQVPKEPRKRGTFLRTCLFSQLRDLWLLQGTCNPSSQPPLLTPPPSARTCAASRPLPIPDFPPGHAGLSLLSLVPSA